MTAATHPLADALRDAEPASFWTDRSDAPESCEPLTGRATCDLLVVGGGFTGLWAAIEAKALHPALDVVLMESEQIAYGASGRNGGFISESLTHGIAHGLELWPDELDALLRLGRENLQEIEAFAAAEGIDAGLRMCGKTAVATKPHHMAQLRAAAALHRQYGEDAEILNLDEMRAETTGLTPAEREERIRQAVLEMRRQRERLSSTEQAHIRQRLQDPQTREMVKQVMGFYREELTARERAELDPLLQEWLVQLERLAGRR